MCSFSSVSFLCCGVLFPSNVLIFRRSSSVNVSLKGSSVLLSIASSGCLSGLFAICGVLMVSLLADNVVSMFGSWVCRLMQSMGVCLYVLCVVCGLFGCV